MAIVDACPPADAPLAQGDLLSAGVIIPAPVNADDEPEALNFPYMLVVSRDCSAIHKNSIVIAPVGKMVPEPFQGKKLQELDYEEVKEYAEQLRDGVTRPDRFYLGNLRGQEERLWAHLDELGTQLLPEAESARNEWVKGRRVGRLSEDFIRALPVRLFCSVSRIGFHDYEWWSDQDLKWLTAKMTAALHKKEGVVADAEGALRAPPPGRKDQGAEKAQANRKGTIEKHREEFAPYFAELGRRTATGAAPDPPPSG